MAGMYYSSTEVVDYVVNASVTKKKRPLLQLICLGLFAGLFIGFGAAASFLVSGSIGKIDAGVGKMLSSLVFPVGLVMVLLGSFELFTSDCLMVMGVFKKKINWVDVIKVLVVVYLANLVGIVLVGWASVHTHLFYPDALESVIKTATYKVHSSADVILIKGILCNIIVCMGAIAAYATKDVISKIFAAFLPIMVFVILGYEHCIANMFYISTAMFAGSEITVLDFIYNVSLATIGNMIGGSVIVAGGFYYSHAQKI